MSPDAARRLGQWMKWLGASASDLEIEEVLVRWERGENPPPRGLLTDDSTHRTIRIRFTHPDGYAAQNRGAVPRRDATAADLFDIVPELDPRSYRLVWDDSGRPVDIEHFEPTGGEILRAVKK